MNIQRIISTASASMVIALAIPAAAFAVTPTTLTVTPNNTQGFQFNRDLSNATPYEFTTAAHSTGSGSLFVKPIGTTASDKFIAEKPLGIPTSDFQSVSYDFKIAGNGTAASANQFYLNAYVKLSGSTLSYDCRYDFAPLTGSTSAFTTASFSATSVANGNNRFRSPLCTPTIAGLPTGSILQLVAFNVGDTSANDAGLAGYFDNVVINSTSTSTAYDFELKATPTNKDQCKKDGFKNFVNAQGKAFKNQGECVSFVTNGGNQQKDTNVEDNQTNQKLENADTESND